MSGMTPFTLQGYRLLHQGARALARVESAGIRIDEKYLDSTIESIDKKIRGLASGIMASEVVGEWKRIYGESTNIQSRIQLGEVLTKVLGVDLPKTESGRPKTDESSLAVVDHPFIKMYFDLARYKKARSTYLVGLKREVVDGFVHPVFNLHVAKTYRSSSDSPNFQNFPVRDPEISQMIRRAFIPRPGRVLIEGDLGGIEVRISACYHHDPVMLQYLRDPTKDMHRDMAMQCYLLTEKEVTKESRYAAKNQFVFPQFYGDWFGHCAPQLWESSVGAKTTSGISVRAHLKKMGITELGDEQSCQRGSFMAHVRAVEADFWGKRFKVYGQWRKDWVRSYERSGELRMLTGFICRGLKKKTEIINYAVQGSAFHCLLWALIRIVLFEIKKRCRLKSLIVGQIHDSLVGDVCRNEIESFKEMVTEVLTELLPNEWKWIIVPLVVEIAVYSKSWAEKD